MPRPSCRLAHGRTNYERLPDQQRAAQAPAVVHFGQAAPVRAHRQQVLAAAYTAHPERFVNGPPRPADLPTAVWINPPVKKSARQDAPGTTIVHTDNQRVARIQDQDEDAGLEMIDRNATLITRPLVSQCH